MAVDSFVFSNCCRLLDGFKSKIFQLVRFDRLVFEGCSRLLEGLKLQNLSTFAVRPLTMLRATTVNIAAESRRVTTQKEKRVRKLNPRKRSWLRAGAARAARVGEKN